MARKRVKEPAVSVDLSDDYRPSENEAYMNERQRSYFRKLLEGLKSDILIAESDKALELRTRDRQRKLIAKIDSALRRIDDGTYGYCEATGEPIGLRRLEARPTATLSLEAQERHERKERTLRDD
jgi:DnaK suppressor protein